jgi:aminobutyraldehyde dehydrogenase
MMIVQREVFGPVVSVTSFSDEDQVLAWANDSSTAWLRRYGPAMWAGLIA